MRQSWKRWKKQIICILAGVGLYLAAQLGSGSDMLKAGYLERNSYGGGEVSYQLLVEGLKQQDIPVEIALDERRYTESEAEAAFERISSQIVPVMLGENRSLDEIRYDMNLVSSLPETGIRLRWESDEPELLNVYGEVHYPENQTEGQALNVHLRLEMTDGEYTQERQYTLSVLPPDMTEEEEAAAAIRKEIERMNQASLTEERVLLPREYEGKTLYYRDAEGTDYNILLVLGFLLAGLCYAKDISDKKEAVKLRNRQMMLDYSEIISKLMVFFGAGMTISSAWERMVKDYEDGVEHKKGKRRYAYEEMCTTYYQMKSGTAEGRAYIDFGRRCNLQPYRKLAGLLEQNRKSGMKNLRNLMQTEMTDAFEQRKNTAKRLGEEASTKLLIPLFITLGIVMVMIVMPAFLSF